MYEFYPIKEALGNLTLALADIKIRHKRLGELNPDNDLKIILNCIKKVQSAVAKADAEIEEHIATMLIDIPSPEDLESALYPNADYMDTYTVEILEPDES